MPTPAAAMTRLEAFAQVRIRAVSTPRSNRRPHSCGPDGAARVHVTRAGASRRAAQDSKTSRHGQDAGIYTQLLRAAVARGVSRVELHDRVTSRDAREQDSLRATLRAHRDACLRQCKCLVVPTRST